MELAPGTLLQAGKYKIIEKLGQGGFGIAYRALHQSLNRDVCIKEFFYSDLCERSHNLLDVTIITKSAEKLNLVNSFKKKFTKEAQRLAKFQHPNIVQVMDTFEENNTAYFVMEYLMGGSLEDLLSREVSLSEQKTKDLILPLIDALDAIHKTDLLHLDIKPANIMLRKNQSAVLIDFGISKYLENSSLTENTKTTAPIGISKGYAPLEQYGGGISDFSKATDIYSLCATIYKMVTGVTPPEPLQMLTSGIKSPRTVHPLISVDFDAAIIKGLATKMTDRHQTISQLSIALGASKKASPTITPTVVELGEPVLATPEAYFNRAEKKRENKQYKEAIEDYSAAIKKDSKDDDYYFFRAICYAEMGFQQKAIDDYSNAIKYKLNNPSAFNNRGVCYSELNRNEDAINDFYRAFDLDQDDLYFDNWINTVEEDSNNTTTLDKYLSHDWPHKDKIYFERGKINDKLNVLKKIVADDFDKAYQLSKNNEYLEYWKNTDSLELLTEYIERELPKKDEIYLERGKLYLKRDDRELGILDLKNAKELGNLAAIEILKSIKEHSLKIIFRFILIAIQNTFLVFSIYFLFHAEIIRVLYYPLVDNFLYYPQMKTYLDEHRVLNLLFIIIGILIWAIRVLADNFEDSRKYTYGNFRSLYPFTSSWFRTFEKINLSIIHFVTIYFSIVLIVSFFSTDYAIISIVLPTPTLVYSMYAYQVVKDIWKKH
jgi:serine/threonine protein kinase